MKKINYLAIIPARSGSKRLKNKNERKIKKISLLDYTLSAAIKTKRIDKIIVTTNIKKLLKKNQKKIFYVKRPKYLCKDSSSTESAILHSLKIFKIANKIEPKNIILLQPTSPFRDSLDIAKSIKTFESGNYNSLFSAYKSKFFLWEKYKKNYAKPMNYNTKKRLRGQNIKPFLVENGAIFIFKYKKFLNYKNRLIKPIGYSIMNKKNSVEIDSLEDLNFAKSFI